MQQTAMATGTATGSLAARWRTLQEAEPNMRIRQMADKLGVSEMELVRLRGGDALIPLKDNFGELLKALESVGPA